MAAMSPPEGADPGTLLRRAVERVLRLRRAVVLVWQAAPGWAAARLGLLFLQGVLPLVALLLLKLVVDAIAAALSSPDPLAALETPLLLVALVGAVGLLLAALQALAGFVNEALGLQLTDHVQGLIHAKSVSLDLAFFETPDYHDHLHRAQREGGHRPARIVAGLASLARNALTLVGLAGLLLAFEPWIVLLFGAAAGPALLVKLRFSAELYRWRVATTPSERLAMVHDWMLTHVAFAKELRSFGLGGHLRLRHRELRDSLRRERMAQARQAALAEVVAHALGALAFVGAMALTVFRVAQGVITLGALVMYYQALQRGLGNLEQILTDLAGLHEDSLFLADLEEFLNQRPSLVDPSQPRSLRRPLREGLVFEHVSFRYPGSGRPALHDVSLELRPGEVVAVVGPNGSGKTTLVKLLCRLYDPDEGRILLDGEDIRHFRLRDLRREIGVFFQDFAQFPTTVRENIGFGDIDRPFDDPAISEAASWAGADAVVEGLPGGLDTPLGKWFAGGHELSAGEWQRLALARSHFRRAQVLVLDEPTSALDALAEARLLEQLQGLAAGRTALLVSHRLSGARVASRIFVLHGGSIVESGSHAELVGRDGVYARMFRAQARRYE
jgi:ATP-binding cassette subfamily B protein